MASPKNNNVDKAPGSGQHVEPGVGLGLGSLVAQDRLQTQLGNRPPHVLSLFLSLQGYSPINNYPPKKS